MFKPSDPYEIHRKTKMNNVVNIRDYYKNKRNKYDKVFKWALDNWGDLTLKASYSPFKQDCISIADQIEMYCNVPYAVAEDIATSISISKAICSN